MTFGANLSFPRLRSITVLDTSITSMNTLSWVLPHLQQLFIGYSSIGQLIIGKGIKSIEWLQIRASVVREIKISTSNFSELQIMDLSHSNIGSIGKGFYLKNLKALYLRQINLQFFSHSIFNAPNVKVIDLDNNPLLVVDFGESFKKLEVLSLRQTYLKALHIVGKNLPSLRELKLDGTPVQSLDYSGLDKLEQLSLKKTNLDSFVPRVNELPMLKTLYLDDNALENIQIGPSVSNLVLLSINNANLSYFNETIANVSNIEGLSLKDNDIRFVDLSIYKKLRYIELSGNHNIEKITGLGSQLNELITDIESISCDCHLISFIKKLPFLVYNTQLCKGKSGGKGVGEVSEKIGCDAPINTSDQPWKHRGNDPSKDIDGGSPNEQKRSNGRLNFK